MLISSFKRSRFQRTICFLLSLTWLSGASLAAENRFLIISGGGTPAANNYSQYLQTRTLANAIRARFGSDSVDVFFGAGNHPGMSNPPADVHAIQGRQGARYNAFIPGVIPGNRAAVKDGIRRYFLPSAARRPGKDDVLFLFVSDHGIPYRGDRTYRNNCILLWYQGTRGPWSRRCLSRRELQAMLRRLPVKRTVFAMSQCYSGGFHQMSVSSRGDYPSANPAVCGFTSTTPNRIASGCTPDVDGPGYQGYERFFTEQLTGINVVHGRPEFTPGKTVREAHRRATLLDLTLDIPMSTTDYYLGEWSKVILNEEFRPRTGKRTADEIRKIHADAASLTAGGERLLKLAGHLREAAEQRLKFMTRMVKSAGTAAPELRTVWYSGTTGDLIRELNRLHTAAKNLNRSRARFLARRRTLRRNHIFGDWRDAVEQGQVPGLTRESIAFEKQVFVNFENRYGHRSNFEGSLKYMFLRRLLRVTRRDRALARRFSLYYNTRDQGMYSWALGVNDPALTRTVSELRDLDNRIKGYANKEWEMRKQAGLTRRILLMRRQFGALVALGAMGDTTALADLRGLGKCESTPYQKSSGVRKPPVSPNPNPNPRRPGSAKPDGW